MKVVLDIDKLLAANRITPEEYARLKEFAVEETGSLAFNILIAFGVVATAGGALALLNSASAAILLGFLMVLPGIELLANQARRWSVLGTILLLVGAITAAGGIIKFTNGSAFGFFGVTALCLGGGLFAQSGLLIALSTLALACAVGAATAYTHAVYAIIIQHPTVTVLLFGLLSIVAYKISLRLPSDYERLALVFARTSLLIMNLGFWYGSLWGDTWKERKVWDLHSGHDVPDWVFVIGWAIMLLVAGAWAVRRNRRWVVNMLAVFGAIHFYTQYFERLGATPSTILAAGLVALGIALAIVRYNRGFGDDA